MIKKISLLILITAFIAAYFTAKISTVPIGKQQLKPSHNKDTVLSFPIR